MVPTEAGLKPVTYKSQVRYRTNSATMPPEQHQSLTILRTMFMMLCQVAGELQTKSTNLMIVSLPET